MKLCLFGIIVCGILSTTDADGVKYKLISSRRSWEDADKDCMSRDGTLVDLDSHSKVMSFQKSITLEPKQTVWTAAYRKHSPWVWIEGCFSASFLTKSDGVRVRKNQASVCSSICHDTTYAALKGSICFCLEDIRELLPMDARVCDAPCPGSHGEMCGGKGAVSLYSLGGVNGYKESKEKAKVPDQSVHEISRADWKNCVYILKHDTAVWITADCRKTLPFLCKIYREEGTVIEYRSPRKKYGSWTTARDMCRREGGTLADLHANNMEAVSALPDHSEYWVGLYRNTSWVWHTDALDETPTWCTSITEDEIGEIHFQTESCSMPHHYVCQMGTPKPSTSSGNMVIYVVCGSIAWVLAILTSVLIFYMMRRRGCRRSVSEDGTAQIHSNYFDLDDESVAVTARPSGPARQHSYVNSQTGSQPTCSQPPPCHDPPLKPGSSSTGTSRYHTACGNEYATVSMTKGRRDASEQYDDLSHVSDGACGSARSSTSTEGDYDHVWDSLKLGKHLNDLALSKSNNKENRRTNSTEHIYTEVAKVTRVKLPERTENDYVTTPSKLFPPIDEFGREHNLEKYCLGRKRSKSL